MRGTKYKKKSYTITLLQTNAHTQAAGENFTTCCCVTGQEGEEPTEKQDSGCHFSTNTAFYMRLMALWNIPSAKSDLALFLPFILAVIVWVPCHNCGSVISPSQYPWKKDRSWRRKMEKNTLYGFTAIHSTTTAEYIYTAIGRERKKNTSSEEKRKIVNSYSLHSCTSEYYSYQATNTTVQ